MTELQPGVRVRHRGEPKAPVYRKKPEPQGPYFEEVADAEKRLADERKVIGRTRRRRR